MSSTSRTRALLAGLVFTAGAAFAPQGHADTSLADNNGKGINTRLFRAAVDSKGFFSVNGTDVLGKGDLAFGLVLDGGFGLLRLQDKDDKGIERASKQLIDTQIHGVLFASYSPVSNLTIGIGIPTDLVSGKAPNDPENPANPAQSVNLPIGTKGRKTDVNAFFSGSYTVNLKYRILRVEDAPIGLAVIVQADLPVSQDAKLGYAADPGPAFTPILALEKRFGAQQRLRIGVNAGFNFLLNANEASKIGDLKEGTLGKSLQ
ncbi:MAG: hypothetical protein JNL79_39930, partial [Myxococcales bacterium]|nr:hypothetical protein [Myxococcales bacterium]